MAVRDFNEVELNGQKYPVKQSVQPVLVSNFPEKIVQGDYTADSNPLASSWVMSDVANGLGQLMYQDKTPGMYWFGNVLTDYPSNITLPRKVNTSTLTAATAAAKEVEIVAVSDAGSTWTDEANTWDGNTGTYASQSGVAYGSYTGYLTWTLACPVYISRVRIMTFRTNGVGIIYAEYYNGTTWVSCGDGQTTYTAPSSPEWNTWNFTSGLATKIRCRVYSGNQIATLTQRIYEVEAYAGTKAISGSPSNMVTFNGHLYCSCGDTLLKMAEDRATTVGLYSFAHSITSMIPSLDNKLYIFLGDDDGYVWMNTDEEVTEVASESGTWSFQIDQTLFKVDEDGQAEYSTNPGDSSPTWDTGALVNDIADQIESFDIGFNSSGQACVYCGTNSKLLELDKDAAAWLSTPVTLPNHPNGGKGLTTFRDAMYVSAGLDVLKIVPGAPYVIENVGLGEFGGLPSEYNGEIVKLKAGSLNELFALVDASQTSGTGKSGLYYWDDLGWRAAWLDTNNDAAMGDVIVSSAESCYAVYFGAGSALLYIDIPRGIRNINQLSSTVYEASGFLVTSIFDGSWRVGNKRANRIRIGTRGVSVNETITVKYRINRAYTDLDTGWTTLGTIKDGDETIYEFGGGAGVVFSEIQFRFDLVRGSTTTNTPVITYATLEYNKIIPKVWGYQFVLDCSRNYNNTASIVLHDKLIEAAETEALVPFVYRGTETHYVEVVSVQGSTLTGDLPAGHYFVIVREVM